MFFGGKVRRMLKKDKMEDYDKERVDVEKGDLPAMIIAGLIVFFPAVLIFGGILYLIAVLISR